MLHSLKKVIPLKTERGASFTKAGKFRLKPIIGKHLNGCTKSIGI